MNSALLFSVLAAGAASADRAAADAAAGAATMPSDWAAADAAAGAVTRPPDDAAADAAAGAATRPPDDAAAEAMVDSPSGADADEDGPRDNLDTCAPWAKQGECGANPSYMLRECAASCAQAAVAAQAEAATAAARQQERRLRSALSVPLGVVGLLLAAVLWICMQRRQRRPMARAAATDDAGSAAKAQRERWLRRQFGAAETGGGPHGQREGPSCEAVRREAGPADGAGRESWEAWDDRRPQPAPPSEARFGDPHASRPAAPAGAVRASWDARREPSGAADQPSASGDSPSASGLRQRRRPVLDRPPWPEAAPGRASAQGGAPAAADWTLLFLREGEGALEQLARGDGALLVLVVEGACLNSLRLVQRVWPQLAEALATEGVLAVRMDVSQPEAAFWLGELGASLLTPVVAFAWGGSATVILPRAAAASAVAVRARLDETLRRARADPFAPRRAERMLGRLALDRSRGFPRPSLELPQPVGDTPLPLALGGTTPSATEILAWQDAEFLAALAADQQEAEAQADAEAEARAAEALAADRAEEWRAERRERACALPPEPEPGPGAAGVLVRLADGRRLARRFRLVAPLQEVVDWVGGADPDVEFILEADFPRRQLTGAVLGTSVGEAGLANETLFQRVLEREEEEAGEG